ncbi:MAG TPA: hypothetical protein DF774_09110 [Rheinheimera sp.]|uniref:hypothetical protein n=1 Tax=Rheinheimera sp. TaxID=1869214 RepID=UPI000ED98D8D|nr:hypothetical protein [Rheinheimera sp.]HCU65905.1 hypothetical protein [Rheinheimera sp.]
MQEMQTAMPVQLLLILLLLLPGLVLMGIDYLLYQSFDRRVLSLAVVLVLLLLCCSLLKAVIRL